MKYLIICCALAGLSIVAADVDTDEKDYAEFKTAKEAAVKSAAEASKANTESDQLTAELITLRKRFPAATSNTEAFKLWRESLRTQPSNDERWNNYEWLTRVERAAIKAGETTDPKAPVVPK